MDVRLATCRLVPGLTPDDDLLREDTGVGRAVLKPRVSATAHGTYVPEIGLGECSLVFVDGGFSHAVLKRPAAGEFRVQRDFGGRVEPFAPASALRAFAERVLAAVPHAWVYARVDVVETARGPTLMELELIEPDLFLAHAPVAAQRLADALVELSAHA